MTHAQMHVQLSYPKQSIIFTLKFFFKKKKKSKNKREQREAASSPDFVVLTLLIFATDLTILAEPTRGCYRLGWSKNIENMCTNQACKFFLKEV